MSSSNTPTPRRAAIEGTPDELKVELRGDAIQVELNDHQADGQAHTALHRVPGSGR